MKRLLAAALTATLLTGPVLAEARDHDRHAHGHRDVKHHVHRDVHRHVEVLRHVDVHRHVRYHAGPYHRPVGYRAYAWHRGAHLPRAYYAPRYIVHDYRAYDLYAPPHGHHWVRVDHDVVLAAIATGAVVAVVHDLFH